MKLCTGFSEPNHGSAVRKHTFAKKDAVMEKGRSEAPRGMLFEVILEPLGRQIVENGGFQISFVLCVFWEAKRGRGAERGVRDVGGVVPLKY